MPSKTKNCWMSLEVQGRLIFEQLVPMTSKHMKDMRNRWYYLYALKNKEYKIYVTIPAKNAESEKNYLTLNLQKLSFNKNQSHDRD